MTVDGKFGQGEAGTIHALVPADSENFHFAFTNINNILSLILSS